MKRKKQKHLLFVLLLLLAIICIGYFFLLRYNKQQEDAEETKTESETSSISLYPEDFDAQTISALSYYEEDTPLSFSLKTVDGEDTWQYDKDKNFPLNQSSLSGMQSQLQALTASRQIQETLENAADYGLDDPKQQITATDENGCQVTLYLGNTNEAAGVTYLYTSASEKIYTIDSAFQDYFSHSLLEMIVEDELPQPDSTAAFQKIHIKQGDTANTFTYKKNGNVTLDYLKQCSWFADFDGDTFAVDDTSLSDLTNTLSTLSTAGCAAYDITEAEKAHYGLDEPTAVITMKYTQQETVEDESETQNDESSSADSTSQTDESETSDSETTAQETIEVPYRFTLTIGDSIGEYYYVTWNQISQVYLMNKSTVDSILNCEKSSFIYKEPFHFSVSDIQKMEVLYQDLSFEYQISTSTKTVESTDEDGKKTTSEQEVTTYSCNGEEIDASEFTDVFGILQNATAEKLYPTSEEAAPIGEEAITITFTLDRKKRSQVTLTLTPYDNNYYALYVDDTPSYLMNKKDVADFTAALPITY